MRSCVFHYEVSFTHPFRDGNGRIARLWQTVMLRRHHPAFAFVPVESVVKEWQKGYYHALDAIFDALQDFIVEIEVPVQTAATRLEAARGRIGKSWFSRKDYMTSARAACCQGGRC